MDEDEGTTELAEQLIGKLGLLPFNTRGNRPDLLKHLRRDLLFLKLDAEDTQVRHLREGSTDATPAPERWGWCRRAPGMLAQG